MNHSGQKPNNYIKVSLLSALSTVTKFFRVHVQTNHSIMTGAVFVTACHFVLVCDNVT